jgi:hypothetical protein
MAGLIVRADAGFEAVLGVALVLAGATGVLAPGDFPHPVGRPLIVVAGLALLPVAVYLWRLDERRLAVLATGNAVTALLGLVWLALASGFSPAGAAVTGAATAVLAFLAGLQVAAGRAP